VRHLDLPPQIRAIDDIARMILAGDECDRPAERQIHAYAHLAIVQERHFGCRKRWLRGENAQLTEGCEEAWQKLDFQ
jgi:hypothetical protein